MNEYIEQLIERRNALVLRIKFLENDVATADGLAYADIHSKIQKAQEQIAQINAEIHRFTFVGPEFPEWVRNQRHREHVEVERKGRIQSAMKKIEQIFGGSK